MNEFQTLVDSVNSVKKSLLEFKEKNFSLINLYIKDLKELKRVASSGNASVGRIRTKSQCLNTLERDIVSVSEEFKSMNQIVSEIDRIHIQICPRSLNDINTSQVFKNDNTMLRLIGDDLAMNLEIDLLDNFKSESNFTENSYDYEFLKILRQETEKFRLDNNYEQLITFFTNLPDDSPVKLSIIFELHKSKFFDFILKNNYIEAALFSKNFPCLPQFKNEIKLMTSALLFKNLEGDGEIISKIKSLIISKEELIGRVIAAAFEIKKYPSKSPLQLCFVAGCLSSRSILRSADISNNTLGRSVFDLPELPQSNAALPVEEFTFHSVFVCPIQQNEVREKDSAIRLECGHALSLHNLNEIKAAAVGGESRIICPCCNKRINPNTYVKLKL